MDVNARREAAEALRAIKRGGEGWFSLSEAVMGRPAPRDEVVSRLADLIDPGEDVSVSAYDLLPEEDREILWWMHSFSGGLDAVSARYREADYRRIELCSALGIGIDTGWSDAMAEMTRRLMPGGYEWPCYENGQPVRPMDKFADCFGVTHTADAIVLMSASYILQESDSRAGELWSIAERAYGSPVKRPDYLGFDAGKAALQHELDDEKSQKFKLYRQAQKGDGGSMTEHDYRRTKRTCRMEYDPVHRDYVCTSCGECYESDMYASVAGNDRILIKRMRYCPRCGARVVDE